MKMTDFTISITFFLGLAIFVAHLHEDFGRPFAVFHGFVLFFISLLLFVSFPLCFMGSANFTFSNYYSFLVRERRSNMIAMTMIKHY